MSTRALLDPELQALPDMFPALDLNAAGLPGLRAMMQAGVTLGDAEAHGVSRSEITLTSADGTPIPALLYQPATAAADQPAYLHIHGGGYVIGSAEASDPTNTHLCAKLGVVVLSVNYRLAPEHPIPAPLDDCYAGLAWLHDNAVELNVDRSRIAIGGESAGGGLAAALAIKARDAGEYGVCHQHLTYPMLDNLTGSEAQPGDPLTGEFVWTRSSNQFGWSAYLGDAPAAAPQVPARLEDFQGLPSTWIHTVGLDLFRDENIRYAQQLLAAGVAVELAVVPGGCHGFQMVQDALISKRYVADHLAALARALGVADRH